MKQLTLKVQAPGRATQEVTIDTVNGIYTVHGKVKHALVHEFNVDVSADLSENTVIVTIDNYHADDDDTCYRIEDLAKKAAGLNLVNRG